MATVPVPVKANYVDKCMTFVTKHRTKLIIVVVVGVIIAIYFVRTSKKSNSVKKPVGGGLLAGAGGGAGAFPGGAGFSGFPAPAPAPSHTPAAASAIATSQHGSSGITSQPHVHAPVVPRSIDQQPSAAARADSHVTDPNFTPL